MKIVLNLVFLVAVGCLPALAAADGSPAVDPGVRGGEPGAGAALLGLDADQLALFEMGKLNFQSKKSVSQGLGPRFNLDSCGGCHAYPALGGSTPLLNPQIAVAKEFGAKNTVPAFLSSEGPIKVVRFVNTPEGKPDGKVHELFVISGRDDGTDASGCSATQEDFAAQAAKHNLSFRIPTPVFGLGVIEQISSSALLANLSAHAEEKRSLGIAGHFNKVGAAAEIGRFGWKAQHASSALFGAEAYNVEMGVTSADYPLEIDTNPTCQLASKAKATNLYAGDYSSLISLSEKNAYFMRFLAPPTPVAAVSAEVSRGRELFSQVGCGACHTPVISSVAMFSDLALHKMGANLADGIREGEAAEDEFRTAPLWGLGQRSYFLHDGRSRDLLLTIQAHASAGDERFAASEANQVIKNFLDLSETDKQDVLNFLRSL
jgi:CxxC motif-containing protein (DUF1111 family)